MNIDQFQKACAISATTARQWFRPVLTAMDWAEINTPVRQAAFLSQVLHETGGFDTLTENLRYRDPARLASIFKSAFDGKPSLAQPYVNNPEKLANKVYANRLGNGDEASGDGWRYRGRGLIQTTGRANYASVAAGTGLDCVSNPDLLASPEGAALSAAFYWKGRAINRLADINDMVGVRRAVNGPGMAGQEDCLRRWNIARRVLCA